MRKSIAVALAAAAAFSFVACKKKETPPAPTPPVAKPQPQPKPTPTPAVTAPAIGGGDVLGIGAVGSLDEFVAALEPYLSAMGASKLGAAAIKAQVGKWIGLESWDGVDGQKVTRVFLVNPKKFKPPFVVALPLQAGKKAAVKGWAVEEIAGHAVVAKDAATITAVKAQIQAQLASPVAVPGGKLTFALAVPEFLAVYAPEIEKQLAKVSKALSGGDAGPAGGDTKKFLAWLARGLVDVARQVQRVDLELAAAKDNARVVLKLAPVAGSALAQFLAAPKLPFPANLNKIPGDVSVAGVFAYSPEALRTVMDKLAAHMESMGADKPATFVEFARVAFGPLFAAMKGDFVYAKRMKGNSTIALMGVNAEDKGRDVMRTFYEKASAMMAADTGDIKSKMKVEKDVESYKGLKYDRMRTTFDYSKLPEMHRKLLEQIQGTAMDSFMAVKDGAVVLAGSTKTTDAPIKEAIDALTTPPVGKSLADKAEWKELLAQLPASRFGVLYISFVDYLKGALSGLAAMGAGAAKLDAIKSEGFLGGSLAVEAGALQVDVVATRSQIESIRKLFGQMKGALGQ